MVYAKMKYKAVKGVNMSKILNEKWVNALPNEAVGVAEDINIEIAKVISERIKTIGTLTPADVKRLTNSIEFLGADFKKITKLIAKYADIGQQAVVSTLEEVADESDEFARTFYSAKGIAARTHYDDAYLRTLVEGITRQTADEFTNLSNTLAYKIGDRYLSLRQMYTQSIDKAIYEVQSGTVDYNTAMRKTIKDLATQMRIKPTDMHGNAKIKWESGYTKRFDSHIRQNMIDGVKQLQSQILGYHGEQFGSDGVELSAHAISAPDHLPVQGRQFSNEEFDKMQSGLDCVDTDGKEHSGFNRPIGQWNCRHVTFPIIIGISERVYSDEQLAEMAENSERKYKLTQQQRAMETKLRTLKAQRIALSAAGDEIGAKQVQKKINEQQKAYRQFSEKNNLLYDTKRASVEGYRRISAKLPTVSEKTDGNITPITDKSINSVKNIKINGYTEQQCEHIQAKHKELLTFARDNNESKECAFICENDLSDFGKDLGATDRLEFKDSKCVSMLMSRPNIFVMHNHPKNSSFSKTDISFFVFNDNIKNISVVKNNGGIEILTKTDKFDIISVKKNLRRAYKNNIKQNTDFEISKAISDFLTKSKEMIEWKK